MSGLNIAGNVLQNLVEEARDFAYSHGIVVRLPENATGQDSVSQAPFTLFPSPVPKSCFHLAQAVQKDYNLLMHRVSHDYDFMKDCLKNAIKVDDFTRKLWEIYEAVRKEGLVQPVSLAMNRSDYMFDAGHLQSAEKSGKPCTLRNIEFNTMASSFGGLASQLQQLHRFSVRNYDKFEGKPEDIPQNDVLTGLGKALATAWQKYGNPSAVIVFLVQELETNIYDQRFLQYAAMKENPEIKVVRKSLKDMRERASLTERRALIIDGFEVAIVYQRCCYVPSHFEGEKDWEARKTIERSKAIKCPSINYHLAGTKKIQQVLAQPGVLEKFLEDSTAISRIRETFAKQYSLDMTEEGDRNVELGIEKPHNFVLKPQREGGGNNIFGEDVKKKLLELKNSEERSAYILMERIYPMQITNYPVLRCKSVESHQMISELGIYGVLVGTKDNLDLNEGCGYLLRTKDVGLDEGGVATGYSALDSPCLKEI